MKAGHVEQARRLLAEAAGRDTVAAPGTPGEREFLPTVVLDADPAMGLCREALFAPLAALMTYRTMSELLDLHAACPYALGASIFGGEFPHFDEWKRLLTASHAGVVTYEDVIVATAHPATPLTGGESSGWGSTQGDEGLLEMTVPLAISTRGGRFRPHLDAGLDPRLGDGEVVTGMLRATHGRTLGERWRGVRQMVRGAMAVRKRT